MITIQIDHCIKCGRELHDPPQTGDHGFFRLNDNRKICEYCYMGAWVDGYEYDRDGNLNRDPDEMDFFEKIGAWFSSLFTSDLRTKEET